MRPLPQQREVRLHRSPPAPPLFLHTAAAADFWSCWTPHNQLLPKGLKDTSLDSTAGCTETITVHPEHPAPKGRRPGQTKPNQPTVRFILSACFLRCCVAGCSDWRRPGHDDVPPFLRHSFIIMQMLSMFAALINAVCFVFVLFSCAPGCRFYSWVPGTIFPRLLRQLNLTCFLDINLSVSNKYSVGLKRKKLVSAQPLSYLSLNIL